MPPRNRDHYLLTGATCCARRCAGSTRTWRTAARCALVIADDGSDDGTAEMLAEYPTLCIGQRTARPGANANAGAGRSSRRLCAPAPGRHAPAHDARHAPAY